MSSHTLILIGFEYALYVKKKTWLFYFQEITSLLQFQLLLELTNDGGCPFW